MTTLEEILLAALRALASALHGLASPGELTLAERLAATAAFALETSAIVALRTLLDAEPARDGEPVRYDEAA